MTETTQKIEVHPLYKFWNSLPKWDKPEPNQKMWETDNLEMMEDKNVKNF